MHKNPNKPSSNTCDKYQATIMDLLESIRLTKELYELKLKTYEQDTKDLNERKKRNKELKLDMEKARQRYERQSSKMVDLTGSTTTTAGAKQCQQEVIEIIDSDSDDDEMDKKPAAKVTPPRLNAASTHSFSSCAGRRRNPTLESGIAKKGRSLIATNQQPTTEIMYESFQDEASVGKTRDEMNENLELVNLMGSSRFCVSAVRSKNGKAYALVLNDAWNELQTSTAQPQLWHVGLGPFRKKIALLLVQTDGPFPLFHSPKKKLPKTEEKKLFYVGHYKVVGVEEFDPPIPDPIKKGEKRQMLITMTYAKFCQKFADIVTKS